MPSLHSTPFHPHHLEFDSVRELPDSHSWPRLEHCNASAETVPLIDLASTDASTQIADACESWGAFQVIGHGVPTSLLDRLEAETRCLFSLPTQQKLKAARSPDALSGYGLAPISSFFAKRMWSEGFTISGSPVNHARSLWPQDYSQFCNVVQEYQKEMKELTLKLMRLMILSLGPDNNDGIKGTRPGPASDLVGVLQLNSYPVCPDPDRAMGLAAHTDSSLLTVLHQSRTNGLQVLREPDRAGPAHWVAVPPIPGALVVNVGDLLHILSNGRFKNVLHRAIVNRTHHRVSVAYICGPQDWVEVSPLVRPGEGPTYRSVTWTQYLGLKAKLFDKALASLTMADDGVKHFR
uniref:gibberellin 3beta-dioxygenase n=1 Tax=Paris polyphylla var. yunnanensis TaxID=221260 RepID=A0A2P1NRF0_PARPY|nr:GA3ox1 [Paris polyphylla var. yunnanensis]